MNLKEQLKIYMHASDMSATDLAKKSRVSKQVISHWLLGTEPRKLEQVKAVADVLGTTVDHLCFGKGLKKESSEAMELNALLGDEWIGGLFEIRFRRVKR